MAADVNYEVLLHKYIHYVEAYEGVNFIPPHESYADLPLFSINQRAELVRLAAIEYTGPRVER